MAKKKLDIITSGSIYSIHGVNYVIKSFLEGKEYFDSSDFLLHKIYSSYEIVDCSQNITIDLTLKKSTVKSLKKAIRKIFKTVLNKKILLFALIKFYFNSIYTAKKTMRRYWKDNDSDYIIFHDALCCYYYYKKLHQKNIKSIKSILVLHCGEDVFDSIAMDSPVLYKNKITFKYYKKYYEQSIKNVDRVVFLSKKAMLAHPWIPDWKKTFIYNGIDDKTVVSRIHFSKFINFACVGTLLERKGQMLLLEGFSKLDRSFLEQIKLFLIGDGEEFNKLQIAIQNLHLEESVFLLGSRNDVPVLLADMDVFILASRTEGMPISILEAMRQGLYIMVTNVGGCSEMISPDMGELISHSPGEIAHQIQDLIGRVEELPDFKINARARFKKLFTLEKTILNYISCLNSL